jgi:hypothetical protein
VYDVNVDGVAQYGLYPDWIEDDMMRGAEAYLQTWERAEGIEADSCRNPGNRLGVPAFRRAVEHGMSVRQVMRAVGQPWQRLGRELTYCAASGDRKALMTVTLTRGARVDDVRRS